MQRWEYAVADFTKLEDAVPELDRLGAEGWEAVGLISTWDAGWRMVHPVVLLKRPRPESAQQGKPVPAAARALPARPCSGTACLRTPRWWPERRKPYRR